MQFHILEKLLFGSKSRAAFVCAVALVVLDSASAGMVDDARELAWASQRDLTHGQFSRAFNKYEGRGFMITDVDAYPHGRSVRYSMIWRENRDGRKWKEHRGMTSSKYNERWRQYKAQGYRPLDVEAYRINGQVRWAGIWIENRENIPWASYRGLTSKRYGEIFQEKSDQGFRLIDMEVYRTENGYRRAAIWYKNTDNRRWAQLRGMTREKYQSEVNQRSRRGLRVIDFESYTTRNGQRYAAIWAEQPGRGWAVRSNRTGRQFANLWRQYRDKGMRLIDFERYNTPSGARYAGIWAENNARYRWPDADTVDTLVENYRTDPQNNIPGMSVVIIQNGDVVYRKGFGQADVAGNKVAHGETVYNAASVSKVIGGTLAAKLEDEGRLRDGTSFTLDLTVPTRTYLGVIPRGGDVFLSMPTHHTHTVENLLTHRACVAHYRGSTVRQFTNAASGIVRVTSTPSINNMTDHFSDAIKAASRIWDTQLITFVNTTTMPGGQQTVTRSTCTPGMNRRYSTPAFTFVGAVLERVTGRPVSRLVNEEIADRYGLDSMRVQFTTDSLPANYERAQPYRGNNNQLASCNSQPGPYCDNSWKVLGGGIETNALDLARFGWKTLNGEIVRATGTNARDTRLFANIAGNEGLAWRIVNDRSSRNVAQHGGSWTGANSFLRLYRNDGLVIAIMTNKRRPGSCSLTSLADSIGDVVLGGPTPLMDCANNPIN